MLQLSRSGNQPDLRRTGLHPDFWYPLARSRDLAPGKTLAVQFAGVPIVLARTEKGKVFALEDRCAHRQVPLSMGVVTGEKLTCAYHAWCYSETGRLSGIPYLPKGAKPPRGIRNYPCRENYSHIFVFPGDPARAGEVPMPELPSWGSGAYKTMYFSRHVKCHYSFMHENLMDMNHQFLHRRLMGQVRPNLLGYEAGSTWIEARYTFDQLQGKRHWGARFLSRSRDTDLDPAKTDIMSIRTNYPYQTLEVKRADQDEPTFRLFAAYVPVDPEQRINHSFGMLMIKKPRILPGILTLLWPIIRYFTEAVFTEDRRVVEAEQRAYDLQQGDWNQEVFPLILDLRRLLIQNGLSLDGKQKIFAEGPEQLEIAAGR